MKNSIKSWCSALEDNISATVLWASSQRSCRRASKMYAIWKPSPEFRLMAWEMNSFRLFDFLQFFTVSFTGFRLSVYASVNRNYDEMKISSRSSVCSLSDAIINWIFRCRNSAERDLCCDFRWTVYRPPNLGLCGKRIYKRQFHFELHTLTYAGIMR